jgi:hypothetical protein
MDGKADAGSAHTSARLRAPVGGVEAADIPSHILGILDAQRRGKAEYNMAKQG